MLTDYEDTILERLAKVQVRSYDGLYKRQHEILEEFGLSRVDKGVQHVFLTGLWEVHRKHNFYERLRLKVLSLDAGYYAKIKEIEDAQNNNPAAIKRAKKAQQERVRREKEWQESRKKSEEYNRKLFKKLETALSFYESWKLSSGKSLGDATKEDLVEEAEKNKRSADGHMKNYSFYNQLSEKVPEGKTVSESVDLVEAHQLRQKVFLDESVKPVYTEYTPKEIHR